MSPAQFIVEKEEKADYDCDEFKLRVQLLKQGSNKDQLLIDEVKVVSGTGALVSCACCSAQPGGGGGPPRARAAPRPPPPPTHTAEN